MSLNSVGFWTRCWRAVFGGASSTQVPVADLPAQPAPMAPPTPRSSSGATPAVIIRLSPEATSIAVTVEAPHASIAAQAPVSAAILAMPSDATRHYMLAARLGSVRALNQPKARARKPAAPNCTTKPLPKRSSAAAAASALKRRRHCASPRVLRPVSTSATIIHLAQRRPMPPAQRASLQRTA